MEPSEKLSCIRFFELVDTNSDGSISRLELLGSISYCFSPLINFIPEYSKLRNDPIRAQKEIDQLFRSINSDPSHQITYTGTYLPKNSSSNNYRLKSFYHSS